MEEVFWKDVKEDVTKINPELAAIIDELNPNHNYSFIKVDYLFGDEIIKDGELQLRTKNKIVSIHDDSIPKKIKDLLSYSFIPLSLLMNKSSEVYVNEGKRSIPLATLEKGKLFGTYETIDSMLNISTKPVWNISSGSRSLFTLPKISEKAGCKRLQLPSSLQMKHLSEHWLAFRYIANLPSFPQQWKSTVLFFSKPWIQHDSTDHEWHSFKWFLVKHSWMQYKFNVDKTKFALLWQAASKKITNRNIKPSAYLVDTMKHLLSIAIGQTPAFIAADDSQSIAPTKEIQNILLDVYKLKHHHPTIMYPDFLSHKGVYYSLSFPTLLEGTPSSKQTSSTLMLDLRDLKLLIDTISQHSQSKSNILEDINFEYFHVEQDIYKEIQLSTEIIKYDNSFTINNGYEFCSTSSFWRGCIKLSKIQNE